MWLIDANRLYDAAEEKYMEARGKTDNVITHVMLSNARQRIQMLIANAPSVDAVPVVRCKDCKYSTLPSEFTQRYGKLGTLTCHNRYAPCNRRNVGGDDFCSYGERGEGGNDHVSD